MKSYTINFNGTGEVSEGFFANDTEAEAWVVSVLEKMGYDADEIVSGDWDANGMEDDGTRFVRMLFWANEATAENDPGVDAVCELCTIER